MDVSLRSASCCGIHEAVGVNKTDFTAAGFIRGILERYMDDIAIGRDSAAAQLPQIFFSVAYKDESDGYYHPEYKTRVDEIAAYIEKHGLGTCIVSEPRINRVHDSLIRVGVWSADTKGLQAWASKNKVRKNHKIRKTYW